MNKRGLLFEILGILVIVGVSIYGATTIYHHPNNVYVGYEGKVYKYSECKEFIKNLSEEKIIIFTSLSDVDPNKFEVATCNG